MKAIILLYYFLISGSTPSYAQVSEPLPDNVLALIGEWESVDKKEPDNATRLIFFPDGKLNLVQSKPSQMRNLRYRVQSERGPLQGEIVLTAIGEPDPQDRIPFTVHFNSFNSINFTYTTREKTETLYLKKVKDLKYGIIPLTN